jgi:hypothetical protein
MVGQRLLPVMAGAVVAGQVMDGGEPLMRHWGVYARVLVSIPALLIAELMMERAVPRSVGSGCDGGVRGAGSKMGTRRDVPR